MAERSQLRVSEGQDGRSERPATGRGQSRPTQGVASASKSGDPKKGQKMPVLFPLFFLLSPESQRTPEDACPFLCFFWKMPVLFPLPFPSPWKMPVLFPLFLFPLFPAFRKRCLGRGCSCSESRRS